MAKQKKNNESSEIQKKEKDASLKTSNDVVEKGDKHFKDITKKNLKAAPKKKKQSKDVSRLAVTLVKSIIGTRDKHRKTVIGLGLKKINQTVILNDLPEIRGMINKVNYLLKVENI